MKNILYILLSFLLLTGCGVTKRKRTENTSTSEKIEKTKDSSNIIENNKAIKDEATIAIPESVTGDRDFDKSVNDAVANILRSINFQKSSGDNSYKLYYDEKLRTLEAKFEIGATQTKETTTNESLKEERSLVSEIKEEIKKIRVPIWAYAILVFLLRKQILSIIGLFFPAAKGIKSVSDLLTPPKKD